MKLDLGLSIGGSLWGETAGPLQESMLASLRGTSRIALGVPRDFELKLWDLLLRARWDSLSDSVLGALWEPHET